MRIVKYPHPALRHKSNPTRRVDAELILAQVRHQGLTARHILLTHGHIDHVAALHALAQALPDAQVAIHEADAPPIVNSDPDATCAGWMFHEEVEPAEPDRLLQDGDTVTAAGGTYDGRAKDKSWTSGMTAAVARGRSEWTVEVAIPFKAMLPQEMPDGRVVLGVNFGRVTRLEAVRSAWCPSESWNDVKTYGRLVLESCR